MAELEEIRRKKDIAERMREEEDLMKADRLAK